MEGVFVGLVEGICEKVGMEEGKELGCKDFVGLEVGVVDGNCETDGDCVGKLEGS